MAVKNLTITLHEKDFEALEELVAHFQKNSISTVTKTDVIKFLMRQMQTLIDLDNKLNNSDNLDNVENSEVSVQTLVVADNESRTGDK